MECLYPERPSAPRACSLLADVRLSEATMDDWRALAALHYRSHRIGGLDKLFALRCGEDLVGIIAYGEPGRAKPRPGRTRGAAARARQSQVLEQPPENH
jgi:hypothetical protein